MSYAYRSKQTRFKNNNRRNGRSNNQRRNRAAGQYIDPSRFVKVAAPREEVVYQPQHSFSDFALSPQIQRNLQAKGYDQPSPIQDQAIPAGLRGEDVIGIASTGTGKTAAFILPILEELTKQPASRALIVAPTRELAQQIQHECIELTKGIKLKRALLIGGTRIGGQLRDLNNRPQLIIGTPGRICDHIERKSLKLHNVNKVVLDEVDRMLDMGFVHDVTNILDKTSDDRQSFFFSATIDHRVRSLIDRFTSNPTTITLKASAASDNVHQDVVRYNTATHKLELLHEVLINPETTKVIVFDETKRNVDRLSKELVVRGFKADSIHGGKSQGQRQRALARFKQNEVSILVATDVAARGIDVKDISHVVNYSIPQVFDDYIHRIGRAGRAGRTGYALTFVQHS